MALSWPFPNVRREPFSDAELIAIFDGAPSGFELVFQIYGSGFELQPWYAERLRFAYRTNRPIPLGRRLAWISEWSLQPTGARGVNLLFTPRWLSEAEARALSWRRY
ncbi:hypothetical protein [Deinococcus sp. QL22]|uniref:hypothetical protein n=1 Tax=Deinococcus sp. QL22 TaxID=2939437 RepID=UPI00201759AD|nr:hypothetical protein [Deinococcus sp. QL22]UQN09306.1 hypothetical protein M1R55_22300 [Deinococcus sp. QL22]